MQETWERDGRQGTIRLLLKTKSVRVVSVFFRFNPIPFNEDDNKFVDGDVAANAD